LPSLKKKGRGRHDEAAPANVVAQRAPSNAQKLSCASFGTSTESSNSFGSLQERVAAMQTSFALYQLAHAHNLKLV